MKVEGLDLSRTIVMARSRRCPASRAQAEFWEFAKASWKAGWLVENMAPAATTCVPA